VRTQPKELSRVPLTFGAIRRKVEEAASPVLED
jgi:hypothetical protein